MELAAEVDRGDVWYDDHPIPRRVAHRPTMILYAIDHGVRRPLVRWLTTIGGWADQRLADGSLVQRWKESDVGPRVWRDLYAGPTWLPPPTTPDRDLVTNLWNGHYDLKRSVMGPGPHAAYGMMLLVHHQVVHLKDGTDRFDDNGIGTHGSASVTSIVNGTSHGCHRLYNQLAVRLADFLLHHHDHIAHGEEPVGYRRVVAYKGEVFKARIDTRGFRYELTPPIPVNVLRSNIKSERKVPPYRDHLRRRARSYGFAAMIVSCMIDSPYLPMSSSPSTMMITVSPSISVAVVFDKNVEPQPSSSHASRVPVQSVARIVSVESNVWSGPEHVSNWNSAGRTARSTRS